MQKTTFNYQCNTTKQQQNGQRQATRTLTDLTEFCDKSKDSTDPTTRILASLAAIVQVQQQTIDTLCSQLKKFIEPAENENGGYGCPPAYIKAFYEEERRQHQIIAMGLPESTMATPMDRNGEDLEKVKEMLSIIEVEHPPVCVYRMGPFKGGARPRLLKIEFPTRWAARHAIHTARQLKSSQKYSQVKLRPSLTKEEREARTLLTQQCNTKRAETNEDYVVYAGQVVLRSKINELKNL